MDNKEGKRDIFGGDARFSEPQPQPKQEGSLKEGAKQLGKGTFHIVSGLRHILLKKIPMNVLFLLIIIGLASFGTLYLKKPTITANVVFTEKVNESNVTEEEFLNLLNENCKTIDWAKDTISVACPVCEEKVCPELNCSTCPSQVEKQNVIYYRCSNGMIVNKSSDCKVTLPTITSDAVATVDDVTLSIDGIDYEIAGNDTAYIKRINYTIINQRDSQIIPKIDVRVYTTFSYALLAEPPQKTIKLTNVLDKDDWIIESQPSNIYFSGTDKTIRLELVNQLNDESIVAVAKKL